MPDGYRRGGTVVRNGRTFHRRGTRIARPSAKVLAVGIAVGAAALFGTGSALTITVAAVGVGALVCYRYRSPIRRALRPMTRRAVRWADKRMGKRNTRPALVARTPKRQDIFDPRDGTTIRTARNEAAAKRITNRQPFLDYAPEGEGWPAPNPDSRWSPAE